MKLKDIASIRPGYPFRGRIEELPGSGVWAVQMKNVSPVSGIDWLECIEAELEGKRKPEYLMPNDVLFAARGSRNYAVLVGEEAKGRQVVASPHFYVIRVKASEVLPEYLAWLLNHGPCQRYFDQSAEGTLTKSIRRTVLELTPVAIPSVEKQQALVSVAATVLQEQKVLEQLTRNGEKLLNGLANDLF